MPSAGACYANGSGSVRDGAQSSRAMLYWAYVLVFCPSLLGPGPEQFYRAQNCSSGAVIAASGDSRSCQSCTRWVGRALSLNSRATSDSFALRLFPWHRRHRLQSCAHPNQVLYEPEGASRRSRAKTTRQSIPTDRCWACLATPGTSSTCIHGV